ncbi:hypothetical protein [Azonexus sp.]|uniref:type II toxin-antitoxin system RelB family antitoxin n=1 Tax=Azonexus sp. TaxID=1872668 RepID=UPI0035B1686F
MDSNPLDPCVSQFETQAQAISYEQWFCDKVQAAIDSDKARLPHDQVMAEMWAAIDRHQGKKVA